MRDEDGESSADGVRGEAELAALRGARSARDAESCQRRHRLREHRDVERTPRDALGEDAGADDECK